MGVHNADEELDNVREIVVLSVLKACMFDGYGGLIGEVEKDVEVLLVEGLAAPFVYELQNSDDTIFELQRNTKHGVGLEARGFVEGWIETRIGSHIIDDRGPSGRGRPARDTFTGFDHEWL